MKIDRFTKVFFHLNCLLPLLLLGWDAWNGATGANPVNFGIRTTGMLALIFLVLSLAVTPAVRLTGRGWLGQFRRALGLYAFGHTCIHFLLFFAFDRAGSIRSTVSEIVLRPYLTVGAIGLLLMAPLAATSTNAMIKRLGGRRWKALHRLAYVAGSASVLHYYMLVKADVSKPLAFAGALGSLLLYRLLTALWHRRPKINQRQTDSAGAATVRPASWSGPMRVAHIFQETAAVRTFRLVPVTGHRLPFDFLPGQYLNLALVIEGRAVRRSYTIASAPTQTGYCEITVKREARGLGSKHLHDAIRVGDCLDVVAPAGRFTFTGAETSSLVLIAGGVGITPLMSQIRYLTDLDWQGEIYLLVSARTEGEIIFRQELDRLRQRHPNLRVTITLSNEAGGDWTGERGRVSPELLTRAIPDLARRRVHICGPTEMADAIKLMLVDLGVPGEAIHGESFASPSRKEGSVQRDLRTMPEMTTPASAGSATSITFSRSGRSAPIRADWTVLEIAEQIGVSINYDCRAGICGQCKTKLLAGRVRMDVDDALDESDRANQVILCCQARCLDAVTVQA
jgi:ferredoxin-NADP reductase/DMSO/TMAO reductase YedYZ heme-binding membrane subunit